jgi:hypothetical protein
MKYKPSRLINLQIKSFFLSQLPSFQSKPLFVYTNQQLNSSGMLHCFECSYTHHTNAGLDEYDVCPDCGNGMLVKV